MCLLRLLGSHDQLGPVRLGLVAVVELMRTLIVIGIIGRRIFESIDVMNAGIWKCGSVQMAISGLSLLNGNWAGLAVYGGLFPTNENTGYITVEICGGLEGLRSSIWIQRVV